jgi:tripartite motif-containing protein 71
MFGSWHDGATRLMWHKGVADTVRRMIGRLLPVTLTAVLALGAGSACAQEPTPAPTTSFGDEPGALRLPEALAIAPGGDLLVGDHFSGRVQRFHNDKYMSSFGLSGQGCGRLGAIGGIAVDAKGNSYVLDTDQQLVQVFDTAGASVRCFGGRGPGLGKLHTSSGSYAASSASGGITVAGDAVYVADASNNRVQRFTLTGKNPKILGKGKLKMPQGLAVKGSRILVADDGNHRVVELTTSGRFVRATSAKTGVRLRYPYDVAFDAHGGAYVADNNLHRIVQLDRHLRRVRTWGSQGHGNGKFVFPRALAIQPDGHVMVADAGNDRVQEFTKTGGFVRSIGINGRARPHVTAPADVAANAFGEVAVADGNGRISWFDLTGRATGAWAQSKSFQNSTAVVSQPQGIDFATDRSVRVAENGTVRALADQSVSDLFTFVDRGPAVSALDVGPSGTTWAVAGSGEFARVPDTTNVKPTWLGTRQKAGRSTTAIAELSDGTLAISEGTSPNQTRPADGTVAHYDATGKLLATWPIPRPAGGEPSIPAGLAATSGGGVWVADANNGRLLRLAADGIIVQTLGTPGIGAGQLAEPRGLEIDCDGGLLVADSGNNRIVRFVGVAPARGCAAAATPTAAGRPPAPVGLHVTTKDRAQRPAVQLGTITATCRRTCTLATIVATSGVIAGGQIKSFPLKATITGSTITLKASAAAVRAMRAALKKNGYVTAGVTVTATAKDGVVDTAGISWQYH